MDDHLNIGLWILTGLISFMVIEKIFPDDSHEQPEYNEQQTNNDKLVHLQYIMQIIQ